MLHPLDNLPECPKREPFWRVLLSLLQPWHGYLLAFLKKPEGATQEAWRGVQKLVPQYRPHQL